jgi:tetratricopeptide (TPR) repeat protein
VAQLRLGAYYEQSGAVDKAATAYEAARAANPGSVNAALGLIRIFVARNEPAKALELAKTARKLAPNDPEVGHVLGRLAYVAGDRVWALGLLQESIRKLSDDPRVLADFADAAYARGQISPAEDAFQGVLAAHPTAAQAAYAKDRLELIGLGKDPSAATAAFAKIDQHLKADPLDVAALMALALTQEKRADIGEAQKTYEKDPKAADLVASVRQVYPDDEFVAKAAGIIFYRQANYARALPLLQEAVRKLTSDAESYFYLGSTQNKLKDVPGCLRSLQRALELGLPADLASEAKQVLATNKK